MENWADVHTRPTYGAVSGYRFFFRAVPEADRAMDGAECMFVVKSNYYLCNASDDKRNSRFAATCGALQCIVQRDLISCARLQLSSQRVSRHLIE